MLEPIKVEAEITDRLGELCRTLLGQFLPLVDRVLKNLHKLTTLSYSFMLTHGDYSEFNLLLDEVSSAISGVINWPEACILPLGFTLHGLEYGIGAMYANGWTYHKNAPHVREHFWATFKQIVQPNKDDVEAMKLARLGAVGQNPLSAMAPEAVVKIAALCVESEVTVRVTAPSYLLWHSFETIRTCDTSVMHLASPMFLTLSLTQRVFFCTITLL